MDEIQELLKRQARWQRARKNLSWPEKVRMAELVRESTRQWRARATKVPSQQSDRDGQATGQPHR